MKEEKLSGPINQSVNQTNNLVFLLHGWGSNGNDLIQLSYHWKSNLDSITFIAPNGPEICEGNPSGRQWFNILTQNSAEIDTGLDSSFILLNKYIDFNLNNFNLGKEDFFLVGFSQGTILSLSVAMNYPEKLKNVVALSGYLNEDILPESIDKNKVSHLNIFSSHGYADQVIPVDWARKTPEYLKNLDINHVYKEYPVGHGVAPQNFYDFRDWLKGYL